MSTIQHLEKMANDIGDFFGAQSREEAIVGISNHIRSYWTPRMRQQIIGQLTGGSTELHELPRAALRRLAQAPDEKPDQPAGGDAG